MLRGGQISRRAAIFSGDGRLVVAPCANEVRAYAVATGEQVASLEGHTAEVTSLALCPGEDLQVYSASLDGTLRLWDLSTRACLSVAHVREAVQHMALHASLRLAYLSIDWRDGASGRVISWHLDRGRAGASALKTRSAGPLAMNSRGALAATIDRHSLFLWRVGPEISQPLNLTHTRPYTCVALSQDDTVLAAGDISGRILIWRNPAECLPHPSRAGGGGGGGGSHQQQQQQQGEGGGGGGRVPPPVPCTTVHWHAAPVGCLSFSPDSVYLRSGGREGVLVSWHLETLKPAFLPRLGGALTGMRHCAAQPSHLLLRQADNTLRVINLGTNEVAVSVLGLRPPVPHVGSWGNAPATCLRPGAAGPLLLVPTHNAVLQLYDVGRERHVALLQAAPRNDVTAVHDVAAPGQRQGAAAAAQGAAAPGVIVSHAAFTHDGSGLVTVIARLEPGGLGGAGVETSVRFWDALPSAQWQAQQQAPFSLNTLADDPHTGHAVAALASHPSRPIVVTAAGVTGPAAALLHAAAASAPHAAALTLTAPEFKVWERLPLHSRPGQQQQQGRKGAAAAQPTCWSCRSVGSYQGMPFSAAAFSPDGSLLALAAGPCKLTLWDALSCSLVAVLPSAPELAMPPPPALPEHLRRTPAVNALAFLHGAPFLVGSSGGGLAVWNLLTASVHWALPLAGVESLVADPLQPRFAVTVPGSAPRPPGTQQGQQGGQQGQGKNAQHHPGRRPEGAAAGAAQDGQEDGQQAAAAAAAAALRGRDALCHVLRFEPASAVPVQAGTVRGTRSVQLLHPPGAAGSAAGGGGDAPLLLLTGERAFVQLGGPDVEVQGSAEEQAAAVAAGKRGRPELSAFEAAFGELAPDTRATAGEAGADAAVPGGVGEDAALRQLLDAPSHLLPPPNALATAFLRLLTEPAH